MSRIYRVLHPKFGVLRKLNDCIQDARDWARKAFPGDTIIVTPDQPYRHCDRCESAPCECERARPW